MHSGHLSGDVGNPPSQRARLDDLHVGTEAEDPGHHLGAEPDPQPHVDAPAAHERLLRSVPAVALDER